MRNVTRAVGLSLAGENGGSAFRLNREYTCIHIRTVDATLLQSRARGSAVLRCVRCDISDIRPLTFDRFAGTAAL